MLATRWKHDIACRAVNLSPAHTRHIVSSRHAQLTSTAHSTASATPAADRSSRRAAAAPCCAACSAAAQQAMPV